MIKLARAQSLNKYIIIGKRSITALSFREYSNKADNNMEKQQQKQSSQNTQDVTAHSFGEGYATRSDEDGFGGTTILGGSDAATKIDQDKMIHENHPAFDKNQGSEVAEKEKGRHQKTPC